MRHISIPLVLLLSLAACSSSGGSNSSGSSSTSSSGSTSSSSTGAGGVNAGTSHNVGLNCLESGCHRVGDSSDNPAFYVGGSVFKANGDPQVNASVRLYDHSSSQLVAELQTDSSGNFYTSEVISQLFVDGGGLVDGVDVELEGPNGGGVRTMPGVLSEANCNFCHKTGDRGRLVVD